MSGYSESFTGELQKFRTLIRFKEYGLLLSGHPLTDLEGEF